ncbi:NADH-quinone oxidoreductase subunit NuoE [Aureimonas sp. ME7]|uniref:NADH-quinone oxidoreductase subunit NuoE n=1 Tax=Aureimonas sp. ME7 TaxID=2744252 RepID=UPI0015F404AB|nr:NADH-quinone oxidoreductase subunit NuoE [Aureimonas sp. ME7]
MSVRRLAEDAVQPQGFAFSAQNADWAEATIRKYPEGRQQSAVIPLLMRAQEQDGWVTKAAIEHVAQRLRMPMIRVLEVATFYTQFQLAPVGKRAHIQVCGTTPCMLRGSDDLKRVCREKIHPQPFHLNESGSLSWEEVECLGACVNAPMVMIFKDTYEDLTAESLSGIIDAFERGEGAAVKKGPQVDRHLSVPIGGLTTLNSFNDEEGGPDEARKAPQAANAASGGDASGGVAPSQAGRPDTHAAETDPSIKGPAGAPKASQAAEDAISVDPSEGAGRPGSGRTGGTRQGPTGADEVNAAAEQKKAETTSGEARTDGPLKTKGAAAEDAVVQERQRVDDKGRTAPHDGSEDLSGKDHTASGSLEAQRDDTSDVTSGPDVKGDGPAKGREGSGPKASE